MNISDIIMNEILSSLSDDGIATFRRNEFAERVGCVPSQINYVITSRFTPEKGYIVSSKRGGGGSVTITKLSLSGGELLMHTINSIGESIDENSVRIILDNLVFNGEIPAELKALIYAAACDITLKEVSAEKKDKVRASLLKNMLLTHLNNRRK